MINAIDMVILLDLLIRHKIPASSIKVFILNWVSLAQWIQSKVLLILKHIVILFEKERLGVVVTVHISIWSLKLSKVIIVERSLTQFFTILVFDAC